MRTKEDWSGWADLNCRPHGPEPCALAWLSYTPLSKKRRVLGRCDFEARSLVK